MALLHDESDWRDELAEVAEGILLRDEPMSEHTTLGVGGPVDMWFEPRNAESLSRVLARLRQLGRIPYTVVGGGSNLLVGDLGIRGMVVHLPSDAGEVTEERAEGKVELTFPAGFSTAAVRRYARERSLVGPEFLIGIPGTLGGAIQMNAGTRLGEMVNVVVRAEVAHPDGSRWLDAEDFEFAYRHAVIPPGSIVTRITLAFEEADEERIEIARAVARAELEKRRATQPRGRSAGSIFKNPKKDYAGRLIEAAGLKGRRIGGAVVSEVHANFIINDGGATARNVLDLIQVCRDEVREAFDVNLKLEVKLLGEF